MLKRGLEGGAALLCLGAIVVGCAEAPGESSDGGSERAIVAGSAGPVLDGSAR